LAPEPTGMLIPVTYFVIGGVALIIFLVWRLTVVSSQREDALADLHKLRTICQKLTEGHGLQQDAIRALRETLDYVTPQQDDPGVD
jgi:hypothetical protein